MTISYNSSDLEILLNELTSGTVLLLSVCSEANKLTDGGIAAKALQYLLDSKKITYHSICSEGAFATWSTKQDNPLHEHEQGWSAAGDLFEKLINNDAQEKTYSHVFCLDPWSADLLTSPRTILPDAKWIFISNINERKSKGESEYWNDMQIWYENKSFDTIIPAKSFLSLFPEESLIGSDNYFKADLPINFNSKKAVLIDEAGVMPPAPEVLRASISKWTSLGYQIVFLSPHLPGYAEKYSELLQKCFLSLDTSDLAIPVYQTLLRSADIYVAPTRIPFQQITLQALDNNNEMLFLPKNNDNQYLTDSNSEIFRHNNIQELMHLLEPGKSTSASFQSPPPPVVSKDQDNFMNWWKAHQQLMQSHNNNNGCEISFLTCCYKYLQRFRIYLDSITRQDYPLEKIEICITVPGNPDGILEYLELFRIAHPRVTLSIVPIDEEDRKNRGKMINAAFKSSSGSVVVVNDGDIILPPDFVKIILQRSTQKNVLGCWRTPLTPEITAQIITGNLNPFPHFEQLSKQWDKSQHEDVLEGMLGYCQALSRSAFAQVMYPEEFDYFNQSDIVFIERLRDKGMEIDFIKDLFLLHLYHHRDWSGTKVFL